MTEEAPPRVHLIVDDLAVRDSFVEVLRAFGFRVGGVFGPASALWQQLVNDPGCLLLDLGKRGGSELDVLAKLRAGGVQVPALILLEIGEKVPVLSDGIGALTIVGKPYPGERLAAWIRNALAGNQLFVRDDPET